MWETLEWRGQRETRRVLHVAHPLFLYQLGVGFLCQAFGLPISVKAIGITKRESVLQCQEQVDQMGEFQALVRVAIGTNIHWTQ